MNENSAITWTNETRKLRDLVPWDHNPREIHEAEADRLGESLRLFGQIQTIAIDPDNSILDGHQRRLVWSVLPTVGPDYEVDVRVSSRLLTERERQQLVVYLHRGTLAEWDWDKLATFEVPDLLDWGFGKWELGIIDEAQDPDELWEGMPEFEQDDLTAYQTIKVHFASEGGREAFAELVEQTVTEKTKFIWYPKAEGGRYTDRLYVDESKVSDIHNLKGTLGIPVDQ